MFMSLELGMIGREIKSFTEPWILTFSLSISVHLGFFAFALSRNGEGKLFMFLPV